MLGPFCILSIFLFLDGVFLLFKGQSCYNISIVNNSQTQVNERKKKIKRQEVADEYFGILLTQMISVSVFSEKV